MKYTHCHPPGWQADAFATNLHFASCGRLGQARPPGSTGNSYSFCGLDCHENAIRAKFEAIEGGEAVGGRKSQQSAFYQFLLSLTPPNWLDTLERKLGTFDSLDGVDCRLSQECLASISQSLKKLGPRVAMAVVKSWANAWTTSLRMHEPILLPCIFGCPGCQVELGHYLCCDPLWTAVISCSFKETELLQCSPWSRLGLDGSSAWLQMVAIEFSCYHAVGLSHRDDILVCTASGHPCQVLDRIMEYARVL